MNDLIHTIQKVLNDCDLVLGWTKDEITGVGTPAWFTTPAETEAAIFDSTCVHNLAVHLPRLKGKKVGIVAKGCDIRSVVQLIVERQLDREQVRIIAAGCRGVIDIKKIWRYQGFGARIEVDGSSLAVDGQEIILNDFLMPKCRGCADSKPVIFDEAVRSFEIEAFQQAADPSPLELRFAAMNPAERRLFWEEQFSRCIRCYACREACPLCFCRDVCSMQSREPHWAGGQVDPAESQMAQFIRMNHMAGRCTGCGECERACPAGIPLMLLLDEQNRVVEEMFAYRAGSDLSTAPPLLTFDINTDGWHK